MIFLIKPRVAVQKNTFGSVFELRALTVNECRLGCVCLSVWLSHMSHFFLLLTMSLTPHTAQLLICTAVHVGTYLLSGFVKFAKTSEPSCRQTSRDKKQLRVLLKILVGWWEGDNAGWTDKSVKADRVMFVGVTEGVGIQSGRDGWVQVAWLVAVVEAETGIKTGKTRGTKSGELIQNREKGLISKSCKINKGWNVAGTDWSSVEMTELSLWGDLD